MSHTIKAVTVSRNCYERKKWSVKLLSVETRKSGVKWWKVRAHAATNEDYNLMIAKGGMIASQQGIPLIVNIRNGVNLSEGDKITLSKYGVAV